VPAPDGLRPLRILHPKESTKAQLVEAKADLQRMLVSIPPTEEERAAVEDGQSALDRLPQRLAEVATQPAGPRASSAPNPVAPLP
jgi:hypothetical protein